MTNIVRDFKGIQTEEELDILVQELLSGPDLVAFDLESGYTSQEDVAKRALDTRHPDFVVVGFSITNDPSWARYVPLLHKGDGNLEPKMVWEKMRPVFEQKSIIAHNMAFERAALQSLARAGHADSPIVLKKTGHDTMLLAKATGKYKEVALKTLTREVLGEDQAEYSTLFGDSVKDKHGKVSAAKLKRTRLNHVPVTPEVIEYGCDDSALCFELFNELYPILTNDQKRVYSVEMQILVLMSQAEEFGIGVDWARIQEAYGQYQVFRPLYEKKVREEFAAMTKDPAVRELARTVNFGSSKQMRDLLYDGLGMRTTRKTKSGAASTDAQALEALSRKHPAVRSLLDLREIDVAGRRMKKWLDEYSTSHDLRVHPSFNQVRVISGRFAAADPAVNQLPKDWFWSLEEGCDPSDPSKVNGKDYWSGNFRKFIIAGEGKELITFDYCVAPNTRILTSNLEWVSADSIKVGDELIGFPERLHEHTRGVEKHAWERTKVVRVSYPSHPCYKITLSDGREVVSSAEHMWAATGTTFSPKNSPEYIPYNGSSYRGRKARKWVKTEDLVPGISKICHAFTPWDNLQTIEEKTDYAYMAGLMDGEGWISNGRTIGFGQADGLVWDKFNEFAEKYNYKQGAVAVNAVEGRKPVNRTYFSGRDSAIKFLALARPVRLFARQSDLWEGYRTWSRYSEPPTVVSVDYVGVQKTVSIETESHTFIAEGLMSHNCNQEYRVLAGVSGERALFNVFQSNGDPHKLTAALVYGKPIDHVTKEERQVGKTLGFSLLYGMGPKSLVERLALSSVEEAESLMSRFKSQYSRVGVWEEQSKINGLRNKYVKTWFGKTIPLWQASSDDPYIRSGAERLAVNAQIQGGAADYTKLAMIRAWSLLKKAGLWGPDKVMLTMNQHDSLTFEFDTSLDPNEIRAIIQEAVVFDAQKMFPNMKIPQFPTFDVDWELGKTWGGSSEWPYDVTAERHESGLWCVPGSDLDDPEIVQWSPQDLEEPIPEISSVSFTESQPALHVIVTSDKPSKQKVLEFMNTVKAQKDGHTSVFMTLAGAFGELSTTSTLSISDEKKIDAILGGATVIETTVEEMEKNK